MTSTQESPEGVIATVSSSARNYIAGSVRTAVPIGVGYLLTWLAAHFHVVLSEHTRSVLSTLVIAVLAFVYFLAARALEEIDPRLGVLLGFPAKPVYAPLLADGTAVIHSIATDLDLGDAFDPISDAPITASHLANDDAAVAGPGAAHAAPDDTAAPAAPAV